MKPSVRIKNISYNTLGDKMKKRIPAPILEYVYEREDSENIQTYFLIKSESTLLLISHQHFYFSILGEKTIEKLTARGYLSIEEVKQKYNIDFIEKQKIKKRH